MSWSTNTVKAVKSTVNNEIDNAKPTSLCGEPALDQLEAAKRAAKELAKSIPGPSIFVTMSGHANGIGYRHKEGFSNDFISVVVSQITEEAL